MSKAHDEPRPRTSDQPVVPGGRRPYARPQLTEYGALAKLTRASKSGTGEFTPSGVKMKCL